MSFLDLVLLSVIQGIAEFLPISSSAHLILFPALTGEADQGLLIDGALHVGTLAAVMLYFRRETGELLRGTGRLVSADWRKPEARLVWLLALATVPVVLSGLVVALTGFDEAMRSTPLIAATTIIFAIALWAGDRFGGQSRRGADWGLRDAVLMGLAQAVAIIPGVSRSGITMTVARALGFERTEAARISLLMSIPATMAVGAWVGVKLVRSGDWGQGQDALIAVALSFLAALAALHVLMRMLRGWSFLPFVAYRLALGAVLVWIAL